MSELLQQLAKHPLTEVAGWTLVHFLWQGLLIAVLAAALLACLRGARASTRYLVACGGLAWMALAPLVTASWLTVTMEKLRESQTANRSVNHEDSDAVHESQADHSITPWGGGLADLALSKLFVASPQNADSENPYLAGIVWRETLRKSFPYFVACWTAGVLLLSMRLLGGLWRVQQWRRRGIAIKTAELKETTMRLAAKMGLKRRFELLESAQATVPAVIGWLKPVVIVPTSLISGLSPAELESLLAHELAHIRRHDYLVNLLQTVIETVLFYHPAVWWLSRVVRYERENCCDDLAVAACGNRMVFVKALTKLEELRCGEPELALSARGGSLLGRIQRLMTPSTANRPDVWWPAGALVFGSIILLLSSLFIAAAIAESDPEENAKQAKAPKVDMPQIKPWTIQPPAAAPLKYFAAGDSDPVSKARRLGDWLEFKAGIRFDSGGYMRLAGELMALDEPHRIEALRAMAEARLEGQTIALCRMLFEAKPNADFRRPALGGPLFVGTSTEMKDWPLEPITLVGEVPLLIVEGYTLAGLAESAEDYLEYCLASCVWSKRSFSEMEQGLVAADQTIRQPTFWGGAIDESEWREWAHLRLQLRPSLVIEVKQQPWVSVVVPLYSVLDDGTSKVSEVVEKVVASGLPAAAPVTLIISDSAKQEWIEPLVRELAAAGYRNQEHIWWQKSHELVKQAELQKILTEERSANLGKADTDWGPADPKTGLRLRLTLQEPSVETGKPVLGKLELQNSGKQGAEYDPQKFSPFRVVQIFDEKGKPASLIGPKPQTFSSPERLAPGESVTLWDNVDLSELYLLDSGNYEVAGLHNDRQRNLVLESGSVRLKVDGGRLPPKLQLLKQLREIAPMDWGLSTSFGAIFLSHSPTGLKQDVTTIQLWFTDEPLPANYKLGEANNRQQVATIASTELGFLHLAAPSKANELWPDHAFLIKTAATRVLSVKAKPGGGDEDEPATDEESKVQVNDLPWQATGRVTNREGQPLAGVTVQAHCGRGTLRRTGEAVTDAEGRYDLQFGPGIFSDNRQLVQAATISISLDGHFEQNLHRQGDLVAALEKPEGKDLGWGGKTIKDLFLPDEPKTIDFVMLPATKLKGVVIGKDGDRLDGVRVSLTGPDLPPSSSVVAQTRTDKGGRFELTDLPTGFAYQLLIEPAKAQPPRLAWASPPLKLDYDQRGHNCFLTEHNGRNQSWLIQELFIQLEGDGINWKQALASASEQKTAIQFDGIASADGSPISSGMATLTLGTDLARK